MRSILIFIASLHPKNKGRDYPQLWYCWPKFTGRKNKSMFKIRTYICKLFTGHEISKTEWGYGGGNFVDRNCRWCDELIKIPKIEDDIPNNIIKDECIELGFFK